VREGRGKKDKAAEKERAGPHGSRRPEEDLELGGSSWRNIHMKGI
jgi:hypothetical protein